MVDRREGSERSRYAFSLRLGKAREGGAGAAAALPNGPVGPPGRRRRRGHSGPEGWGPQQGRQGGGRRGVGTSGRDVAMLAPSSSASLTACKTAALSTTTHLSRSLIHGPFNRPGARSPAVFTNRPRRKGLDRTLKATGSHRLPSSLARPD